jgi:hypothetical protein
MMKTRLGIKVLGACALLCLCLGAYGASVASASGEWRINSNTLTERGESKASVSASAGESFVFSIPWYETELLCKTASLENGLLFTGGTSTGTWLLSSCSLTGPPFVVETCKLIEPLKITAKGTLVLHNTRTYQRFEAEIEGTPLAVVKFKEGTKCPLPLSNEITGVIAGETKTPEQLTRPVALSPTIAELLKTSIEFGGHPATLKGNLSLSLGGKTWTGIAGPPSEEERLEEWTMGGPTLTNWELKEAALTASPAVPSFVIETSGSKLQCKTATAEKFVLKAGGLINGTLLFGNCSFFFFGKEYPTCAPKTPPYAKLLGQLVLSKGTTYVLFKAAEPENRLIRLTLPEGCPLEGESPVFGSMVASCEGSCATEALGRTLVIDTAATSGLFPSDTLKYLGVAQQLKINVTLQLASPYSSLFWGGKI